LQQERKILLASVPLAGASFSNGKIYYEWQIDHALGPFHGGPDTELLEIFISPRAQGARCAHAV